MCLLLWIAYAIYRGSYMSAHVLLNLLNKFFFLSYNTGTINFLSLPQGVQIWNFEGKTKKSKKNKLWKRDKMRGLPSILSFFHNEFNKFNYKGARMFDSIFHMTLKLLYNHIFGVKSLDLATFTQH